MGKAIPWGGKVTAEQLVAVMGVQQRLGLDAGNLLTCMNFESGLNPAAKNPHSSATGLIQFMAPVAIRLGTTTLDLAKMNFVKQLGYVEKYFASFALHGHDLSDWSLGDTYMAILWPKAIGKPNSYVMFVNDLKSNHDAYDVNMGLDGNKDGKITKQEVCVRITKMYQEGLKPQNVKVL